VLAEKLGEDGSCVSCGEPLNVVVGEDRQQ
jgi:hypothetical protein